MYREAIITFVDILGFKQLINTSSASQILDILDKIKHFSGLNESEDGEGFLPKIIQFSDSIIRIRPLDSSANSEFRYGVLFNELNDLVLMQGELINHGICIRGGISIGKIYFDENNLFGPGFVKAYELESIFANYPRIVVDPLIIEKIKSDPRLLSVVNSIDDEIRSISSQIRIGSDGLYFIDYLSSFPRNVDEQEYIPLFFENNKKLIIDNLHDSEHLTSITSKYLWLATYHNNVISEWAHMLEDHEQYIITENDCSLIARVNA